MKLSLSEFDDYAKKLVSEKVSKETSISLGVREISSYYGIGYRVDFGSNLKIKINGGHFNGNDYELTPIIKSGSPNIELGDNLKVISFSSIYRKPSILNNYKELLENIPELILTIRDIKWACIYLSKKSNLRYFEEDLNKISLVAEVSKEELAKGYRTLFVQKLPNSKYVLKYNPPFVAEAIIQDYIFHYADVPGYENYKGAYTTFNYLVGHEIMHYRNDHFSKSTLEAIKRLFYPIKGNDSVLSKGLNKKIINNIFNDQLLKIPEYQNNSLMSAILGVTTSNGGMGRIFHSKTDNSDYSGLYSGYLKLDRRDKDTSGKTLLSLISDNNYSSQIGNKWSFKDIKVLAISRTCNMSEIQKRHSDSSVEEPDEYAGDGRKPEIIWPYITPYPTDEDILKFISLVFLSYLEIDEEAATKEPEEIDGYQVGDLVIIKKTGKRAIVTKVTKVSNNSADDDIELSLVDPDDSDVCLELLKEITKLMGSNYDAEKLLIKNEVIKSIIPKRQNIWYHDTINNSIKSLSDSDVKSILTELEKILQSIPLIKED